jgi:hypothetical protein
MFQTTNQGCNHILGCQSSFIVMFIFEDCDLTFNWDAARESFMKAYGT